MTPTALRRIEDLPSPPGWPLLGHTLMVRPRRLHLDVERWARQCGALFTLKLGRTRQLVVADHALMHAVLRDRPDGFRRSPFTSAVAAEMGLPQGVFSAEGEDWRRQRRMVMAAFAPGHVRAYFPTLQRVGLRLRERWRAAAREGRAIDLQADLMRFTVDAISGLAFGRDINTLQAGDDVIQRHLDKVLPAIFRRVLSLLPYWRWFSLPRDRALARSVAAIESIIAGFVADARARLRDDPGRARAPGNLLEAMIVAADEPGSGLGDRQVAGNVLTMLLAGEDTTANTLAWAIHLLHRHPEALQRATAEVRAVVPDAAGLRFEQLDALRFVDACIHETMRLEPVAPFIGLQALRDTVVGDVAVPKGAQVFGLLRHDSVAEPYFDRPADFLPQRWLDEAEPPLHPEARRTTMPFGGGPRTCPGRYLALTEMKLALAVLLSAFDIVAVDTPDGGPAEERMAFTMHPVGLRLRLREAAPAAKAAPA